MTGFRSAGGDAGRRPTGSSERPDYAGTISFLRRFRRGLDAGLDLPEALARGAVELPHDARAGLAALLRRLEGDYAEDDWGFDEEFADLAEPFFEFLYDRWWRVQAVGAERVPAHGRALLVANHAGILPWDATMIGVALLREHPLPRHPRFLVLDWAFDLPFVSIAMRKLGGVMASPDNARALLEQDHLVAVFPEGVKGTGKDWSERYRLQRFGRGGFVEVALRTGAPIVPVAVVGSEEIYPKLGELRPLARLLGAPYFPVTPDLSLARPAGHGAAAVEVADRVLRTDRHESLRPRRRQRSRARVGAERARARHDPADGLRQPRRPRRGVSAALASRRRRLEVHAAQQVRHRHRLGGHLPVGLLVGR